MDVRRIAWFGFGVLAALIVSALGDMARAQVVPPAAKLPTATQPSGVPQQYANALSDDYAAPGIPPPVPRDDTGETQAESDDLNPPLRQGERPIIQDGDLNYPAEPQAPQDGIIDVGEPVPPQDGIDPTSVDTRPQEEFAIFENPPAGHDPLLFQIEDIDPVTDNRTTARLFRSEPYDPVGIKIGSFVLFPELELGGSWYSNVFRSPASQSDTAFDLKPSARLVSNWTRHALEFRTTGGLSWFNEFPTENDRSFLVEGRGRIDVTRRTNVQAIASHERSPESRSALDASSAGTRSTITTDRAEGALNHRFNRLSVQLRGGVSDFAYGETETLGVATNNSDRDYVETRETARASWEFKPTFSVYSEVSLNQRDYDIAATSDGINRSSNGQRYRAGISFGNTGQILRGEIGIGYGAQTPDDARLHSVSGLIIDANATWRVTDLTSLLFTAQSDVTETTTANVGGAFSRSIGVEVRHQLRRYLVASAGLTYTQQDSQDSFIDDRELRTTLGLEYYLSREALLFGQYVHSDYDSVGTAGDYRLDEVHFGMRLRR